MRKFVPVLFLLLFAIATMYSQKTRFGQSAKKGNPADFTTKAHISSTHMRHYCNGGGDLVSCGEKLFVDVIVNGKKLELSGSAFIVQRQSVLIVPGDYPVRLTKDIHNADGSAIYRQYDLLLPDNSVWHCDTSGISE